MRKVVFLVGIFAIVAGVRGAGANPNSNDVPVKAKDCAICHGVSGISTSPVWPNLAGQKKGYMEKQIRDFQKGLRSDQFMTPIAKSLDDKDIEELTNYFSGLQCR